MGKRKTDDGQVARLLAHLRRGNMVTPLDSWRLLGIYALSQRVGDLKRQGHNVLRTTIKVTSPHGNVARVAGYWLEE